ncbi:MAG TPA: ANTAR domain-containing protein [Umezawaea sp.]|nr:ANTAR domain-containing protein [Umezawaea sp.]
MVGDDGQVDPLSVRIAGLEAEVAGLRKALQTRTVIGQATGLIAAVQGLTPQQGFQLLVRMSQHHNVKLHSIAVKLVDLAGELGPRQAVRSVHLPVEPHERAEEAQWPGVDVVEAARQLVAAHEAAHRVDDAPADVRRQLADELTLAGQLLAERLADVGWLDDEPVA